jgi:hypothetical protein
VKGTVRDGKTHLIPHELNVSHDGLARDLELHRHGCAIGMTILADEIVDAKHPGKRRARVGL